MTDIIYDKSKGSSHSTVKTDTGETVRAENVVIVAGNGGGSGGPTTASNVSMTPVDGVDATNVQDGMAKIGQSLEVLSDSNAYIEWDKSVDAPEEGVTGACIGAINLGQLAPGTYEFYFRAKNYIYSNNGNVAYAPKISKTVLTVTNDSIYGYYTLVLSGHSAASINGLLPCQESSISINSKDNDLIIPVIDFSNYGSDIRSYYGGPVTDLFTVSKIKNIETGESFSIKELKYFTNADWNGYYDYVGTTTPYLIFLKSWMPIGFPNTISYQENDISENQSFYIGNFLFENIIDAIFVVRNTATNKAVSGVVTRISANKFTKSFALNELGADIEYGNLPNGQIGPYIKNVPAGHYALTLISSGWTPNISSLYFDVGVTTKIGNVLLTDHQVTNLDSAQIDTSNINSIVQYIGETTDGAVQGYFYKATATPVTIDASATITPVTPNATLSDPNLWLAEHAKNFTTEPKFGVRISRIDDSDRYTFAIGPSPASDAIWEAYDYESATNAGVTASLPDNNVGYFEYEYSDAKTTLEDQKWVRIDVQTPGINNDASLYTLTSLASMFQFSTAKLAKVYNENKLPTTGAYTVFSLGWTYTDSENAPALLAVELATGKFYYYHGTEANCKPSTWKEFNFGTGGGSSTDNNGLEGDYCARYGIVDETQSGLPRQGTGNQVIVPAQMVMDIPGVPGLTINSSQIVHDLTSTTNCELFLANGNIIEATDVFFQQEEPEDGNTGFAAWWNGTEWKFKSNDTDNVFRAANAVRIAKCVFTDGNLTRLCFTGCRLLNKQEFAPKDRGLPDYPTEEGTYTLKATVATGGAVTVAWVKDA